MRIATFNLENLDDETGQDPSMATRVALMRPQLERIAADILCLQEARGSHRARRAAGAGARRRRTPPAQRTPGRTQQPAVEDGHLYRDHPLPRDTKSPAGPAALDGWWWPRPRSPPSCPASSSPMPSKKPVFPRDSTSDQWFDHGQFDAYEVLGRYLGDRAVDAAKQPIRARRRSQETDSLDPSRSPGADHDSACSPSGRR